MQSHENTVRLYPVLRATSGFMAWIPVFFLYLSANWSLEQVMALAAIYYVALVTLEVPSGYLSDRYGRRLTLTLGATSTLLATILFILGGHWWMFVLANIALASGIAMRSESDTALHF